VEFYCTDESLGSKIKTFPSIVDSYEILDFIFPPILSSWCLGHVSFTVQGPSLVQSGFISWNRWLEKMVGANGKVGPNPRLVSIEYTKRWWKAQFKKRQITCIDIQK
jgi:hypothetical protein